MKLLLDENLSPRLVKRVIWIQRGNCSTAEIEHLLRSRSEAIIDFGNDPQAVFLALR